MASSTKYGEYADMDGKWGVVLELGSGLICKMRLKECRNKQELVLLWHGLSKRADNITRKH
jgi:hypothetical protein